MASVGVVLRSHFGVGAVDGPSSPERVPRTDHHQVIHSRLAIRGEQHSDDIVSFGLNSEETARNRHADAVRLPFDGGSGCLAEGEQAGGQESQKSTKLEQFFHFS